MKIALLFFSRSAQSESQYKTWRPAQQQNAQVAHLLINRSLGTLKHSGFPVFHVDENCQEGATFGERLRHAYQTVFDQGYDAVVAFGNDTTSLDGINWRDIEHQLARHDLIFGGTQRGGTYVLGLNKKTFDQLDFDQLPWQTRQLLGSLRKWAKESQQGTHEYPVRWELNDAQDLHLFLKLQSHTDFSRLYKQLWTSIPTHYPPVSLPLRSVRVKQGLPPRAP